LNQKKESQQGAALYSSNLDIQEISSLITDIRSGRRSRNKNFFILAEVKAYLQFRRAKLLMSLIDDLNHTATIQGNKIEVQPRNELIEVRLFNPVLRYKRKVMISEAELSFIQSQTDII